jgi:hypothetical protein
LLPLYRSFCQGVVLVETTETRSISRSPVAIPVAIFGGANPPPPLRRQNDSDVLHPHEQVPFSAVALAA